MHMQGAQLMTVNDKGEHGYTDSVTGEWTLYDDKHPYGSEVNDDEREKLAKDLDRAIQHTYVPESELLEAADALIALGWALAVPAGKGETTDWDSIPSGKRNELVEGAVDAIEMNVRNRTQAYNVWNNLMGDERFVSAVLAFRAPSVPKATKPGREALTAWLREDRRWERIRAKDEYDAADAILASDLWEGGE